MDKYGLVMVTRHVLVPMLLIAAVGCDSESSGESPNSVDVSAAAVARNPSLLLDCPDEFTQAPVYDWEEFGVYEPTVADAVAWFSEQMPDEFHGAMVDGQPLLDLAFEIDGVTHVPVAVDDRVIVVLEVVGDEEGRIVGGAVACDSPIPANG